VPTVPVTGRADLTDAQWAVLEPLLPRGKKPGRRRKYTRRQLIDGIRWRVRTGAVAGCPGPVRALAFGVRAVPALAAGRHLAEDPDRLAGPGGCGGADHLGCVGGLHRGPGAQACGRGAEKGDLQAEPPGGAGDKPDDHGLGRSRGGLTTKVHLACEQDQKPLSVLVTAGQRGDSPQFQAVLERIRVPRPGGGHPRTRPGRVLADKAYGSRANRAYLRRRKIACTIPGKADQVRNRKNKGRAGGPPARVRPAPVQAVPRRGMRDQPAQAQPRRRHPLRQAGRPLRSHPPRRRHQRMAPPRLSNTPWAGSAGLVITKPCSWQPAECLQRLDAP